MGNLLLNRVLPFNDTDAYRVLKVATEAFLMLNCASLPQPPAPQSGTSAPPPPQSPDGYLVQLDGAWTLPYLRSVVQGNLNGIGITMSGFRLPRIDTTGSVTGVGDGDLTGWDGLSAEVCEEIIRTKLTCPFCLELIWSYWHEEGMLVQTMNAISRRFQNIRGPDDRDPLAAFETDPLRPLNNLLWGYIQDEQHRLSLVRRAYEYDHEYGVSLAGRAVPQLRPADSRSKFLEAFHNLLYLCTIFFQQDDDTTVRADGFPLLNALQEVHLLLTQGAHNQFGDLPSTAREEMLIQQWLLARPEFREFLPTRVMVDYPEGWMGRVDVMKSIQGWTDISVMHFHTLAVSGERLLLSARYGDWNDPNAVADQAVTWARFWRSDIQRYMHAYRAVTGVDLTAEVTDTRLATERALQPSVHLLRQLQQQRRGLPAANGRLPRANGNLSATRALAPGRNGSAPSANGLVPASRREPAQR
jgi:hypothetical protein